MRQYGLRFLLQLILRLCLIHTAECLDCFTCTNVHNVSDCLALSTCPVGEQCFTKATGLGQQAVFNLGCRSEAQCWGSTTQSSISAIVGRDITDRSASTDCDQCCSVDFCNRKMCNHAVDVITSTDGQCRDDADYSCELVSGTFNICGDIQHAKTVCRKWCGLCDLVDGNWSSWVSWSNCDVTCGHGHRSRMRTCTEPSPSHGGLDCSGASIENDNCTLNPCPVHGGWSLWTAWGSCSVTCGMGLMRRDRTCSNPYPDLNGDHCFGDSRDDRACFERACADGGWTQWANWGSCSASCGIGLKTRTRTCSNPSPSLLGKNCEGNNEDKDLCNSQPCPDDARTTSIAFRAQMTSGITVSPVQTLVFPHVNLNNGSGYDPTSGHFTAPVNGMYLFTVQLCVQSSKTAVVNLVVDNVAFNNAVLRGDNTAVCHTVNDIVLLDKDITVWVTCASGSASPFILYTDSYRQSAFAGVLL